MNFSDVKELFSNEWIDKLCDDLTDNSEFAQRNKIDILESLLVSIKGCINLSSPMFNEQREAYLFVADEIDKELEDKCYITL